MTKLLSLASRVSALPILSLVSESAARNPTGEEKEGYLRAQRLAIQGAKEVANMVQEGWTERRTADVLDTWLQDHGVKSFFHRGFAWFGERARFSGFKRSQDFMPSSRVVREGEIVILDVAPIVDGFVCDIGYTTCLGANEEFDAAMSFLRKLRTEIPSMFEEGLRGKKSGGQIWREIDQKIKDRGYDNAHALYPFAVVGHRVHAFKGSGKVRPDRLPAHVMSFGWQSYWSFLSRGLFGQLLNGDFEGSLKGLWAIEPHIGVGGPKGFGAKFEEILVVADDGVRWLDADSQLV